MSSQPPLVHRCATYPGSRCRWVGVTRLRELEAIGTVEGDHRCIQRDPNSCGLLKCVRFRGDDPRKVSVHFYILGETASFLVNAATKGSCDLIAKSHRNTGAGSNLYDDPREVAPEDCSWAGATS